MPPVHGNMDIKKQTLAARYNLTSRDPEGNHSCFTIVAAACISFHICNGLCTCNTNTHEVPPGSSREILRNAHVYIRHPYQWLGLTRHYPSLPFRKKQKTILRLPTSKSRLSNLWTEKAIIMRLAYAKQHEANGRRALPAEPAGFVNEGTVQSCTPPLYQGLPLCTSQFLLCSLLLCSSDQLFERVSSYMP